jgi:hypothetical protein
MAQTFFPFDAGAGAASMEDQWTLMAQEWLGTGVIKNDPLGELAVFGDSSGMQVKVPAGKAWIEGHFFQSDAQVTLPIAANATGSTRIDRVIVDLDKGANTIALAVLQGVAGGGAPALTQTFNRWQLPLAQVTVGAGVALITAGNVTDERKYATAFTDRLEFTPAGAGAAADTFVKRAAAGGLTIAATPIAAVELATQAGVGQTGDQFQALDSGGTPVMRIGPQGWLALGRSGIATPSVFPLNVEVSGTSPMARFGSSLTGQAYGLTITTYAASRAVIASGAYRDASGLSVAQSTSAAQLEFFDNSINLFGDNGLTSGSTYTRTMFATIGPTGARFTVPVIVPSMAAASVGTPVVAAGAIFVDSTTGGLRWRDGAGTLHSVTFTTP